MYPHSSKSVLLNSFHRSVKSLPIIILFLLKLRKISRNSREAWFNSRCLIITIDRCNDSTNPWVEQANFHGRKIIEDGSIFEFLRFEIYEFLLNFRFSAASETRERERKKNMEFRFFTGRLGQYLIFIGNVFRVNRCHVRKSFINKATTLSAKVRFFFFFFGSFEFYFKFVFFDKSRRSTILKYFY